MFGISSYPDDATAYGQQSRLIMRAGYVADDSLIGFHFSNDADRRAVQALQTAVELAPDNMVELSRLGYLHAIQCLCGITITKRFWQLV